MTRSPDESARIRACSFSVAKAGHRDDEYEDAVHLDVRAGRFAIADGASESAFAAIWAQLLTDAFIAGSPSPSHAQDWLIPVQQSWLSQVQSDELPWYAEMKRDEEGAYATLLGLEFLAGSSTEDRPSWRAVAVGDSCLFQLRGGQLYRSFPIEQSEEFSNRPELLGSRETSTNQQPAFRWLESRQRVGDRFLLMTDALAQWCLTRQENGRPPWNELDSFQTISPDEQADAFTVWVTRLREEDELRNDDVTLVMIDLPDYSPEGSPR